MSKLIVCVRRLLLLSTVVFLVSCVSSGAKTQYFSLFSHVDENHSELAISNAALSVGIGPIIIPEYMDNPGVVSITSGQQVRVSGAYAWAGDLKTAMMRVLASDLADYWKLAGVWAFPWDNRVRPDYQIRLVFDKFSGERGGEVVLSVTWTLLNQKGNEILLTEKTLLTETTANPSADNYVVTLNKLLNQLSLDIAKKARQGMVR